MRVFLLLAIAIIFLLLTANFESVQLAFAVISTMPAVIAGVAVTLTLGIGIATGVFTVINAVAFRARVDRDPDTFVKVQSEYSTDQRPAITLSDYLAYRERTRSVPTWQRGCRWMLHSAMRMQFAMDRFHTQGLMFA